MERACKTTGKSALSSGFQKFRFPQIRGGTFQGLYFGLPCLGFYAGVPPFVATTSLGTCGTLRKLPTVDGGACCTTREAQQAVNVGAWVIP